MADHKGGESDRPDDADVLDDGPLDAEKVYQRIESLLTEMSLAADANGLTASNPFRFMMRLFSASVRCSTALLCETARVVRTAADEQATTRDRDAAVADRARRTNAAVLRACLGVAGVAIIAVAIVCLVAVTALTPPRQADFRVDLEDRNTGSIECGAAARDAAGDYHCTMKVVLTAVRRKR